MQAPALKHSHSFFSAGISFRTAITAVVALGLLSLGGCSALQKKTALPEIPLLPPAALGQHLQLTQSVTLTIDPRSKVATEQMPPQEDPPLTLLAVWSVDEQGLNFAGLTPAGQVLMTLQYDGERFSESYSPLLYLSTADAVKDVPGREILAQLQLCYWPLPVIEQHLENGPWRIFTTEHGRALYLAEQLVLDIRLSPIALPPVALSANSTATSNKPSDLNEHIEITNTIMRNTLTITTLARAVLP